MKWVALTLISCVAAVRSQAYELETHQWITTRAVERSVLGSGHTLVESLGFDGDAAFQRFPSSGGAFLSIEELVSIGSVYEDDAGRPLNHFFDPQHGGRALTVSGVLLGLPSPDWVIEDKRENTYQHYSLKDTRDRFYRALTSAQPRQRRFMLGLMMESLGRSVHHIQDMAQPEHVRNDQHLVGPFSSKYEAFSNLIATSFELPSVAYPDGTVFDITQYGAARHFWQSSGKGIAEFTSHNFVSNDTNFHEEAGAFFRHPEYPFPDGIPCIGESLVQRRKIEDPDLLGPSVGWNAEIWFVATPIKDRYLNPSGAQTDCNRRTASYSILDPDLEIGGFSKVFSLNTFNFREAHKFLIPRAIAYSAALIDHFFRGRLSVEEATEYDGGVTLRVSNSSSANAELARVDGDHGTENFEVWYDRSDGTRRKAVVTDGAALGDLPVPPNAEHRIRFQVPDDVDLSRRSPYILVFRGMVGAERGVVGQVFSTASPTFLVTPNYLPDDGIAGPRVIRWDGTQWRLTEETGRVAGNVDWRGHGSGDVLTWDGPASRYFYADSERSGISPNIYYGGRLLARAPGNVLGTAVRKGEAGRELVAVVYREGVVSVFVRPLLTSYSNDSLFDAATNPHGWRGLYSESHDAPSSPMYFNASGKEGQMLVRNYSVRTILRMAGESVSVEHIENDGEGIMTEYYRSVGIVTRESPTSCNWVYEGEKHTWQRTSWHKPIVACADYVGDTEALCAIRPDRDREITSSSNGSFVRSGGQWYEGEGSDSYSISDRHTLSVGEVKTAVGGKLETGVSFGATTESQYPESREVRKDDTSVDVRARVIFADARNSAVTLRETTASLSTVVVETGVSMRIGSAYTNRTTTTEENESYRMSYLVGRRKTTLDEELVDGESNTSSAERQFSPSGFGCSSYPAGSNTERTRTFDATGSYNVAAVADKKIHDGSLQYGYAASRGGRELVSQDVVDAQGSRTSTWNWLSGGDLRTLIPGAPEDARYYPVGVIF